MEAPGKQPLAQHVGLRLLARIERVKALLSDDHFSVDGTLIDAWASMKSFRPKDEGGANGPSGTRLPRRSAGRAVADPRFRAR